MDGIGLLLLFLLSFGAVKGQEDVTDASEITSWSTPPPYESTTEPPPHTEPPKNKSISELVQEQTDAIKKIIAEHKPPNRDFPVIYRKPEAKDQATLKAEKERQFIEELRMKCQHFFRTVTESSVGTTERPQPTVQAFGPPIRPEFFNYGPKFPTMSRPKPTKMHSSGYYYVFSPTTQTKNHDKMVDKLETAASEDNVVTTIDNEQPPVQVNNQDYYNDENRPDANQNVNINPTTLPYETVNQNFKYAKLEPLVLQKTLLTNGKTLFYWYRLLTNTQSFVRIPDIPEMEHVSTIAQPQNNAYQNVPLPDQYPFFVDPQTGALIRNVQPKPNIPPPSPPPPITTTTYSNRPQFFINPQTGLIYQAANPQQFIYHKLSQETVAQPPTTTQKIETTTTEQPKPMVPDYTIDYSQMDNAPQENYRNEFRFVVPMFLPGNSDTSKYPYGIDPYAYLPKEKRPDLMNIAVPYIPNYHMIKTLAVPKKYQQVSNEKSEN